MTLRTADIEARGELELGCGADGANDDEEPDAEREPRVVGTLSGEPVR